MLSKKHKILLIVLIITSLFLLNKFALPVVRNSLYFIFSPLEKMLLRSGEHISTFLHSFFRVKALKAENEKLLKQNFILLSESVQLKALKEENQTLREALNLKAKEKLTFVLTEMFAQDLGGDFILITGGKKDGILENMPVITPESVLVGKVKESFSRFARVELISAPNSIFEVEIHPRPEGGEEAQAHEVNKDESSSKEGVNGEKKILAIAKGKGGQRMEFDLAPKAQQIKKGALVLTTTLGGSFPKGLLVGEVIGIWEGSTAPYQRGELEPYFRKVSPATLFVITNFEGYVREE